MFDVDEWRMHVQRRLRRFIRKPRQEPAILGTNLIFNYLALRVLEPFLERFSRDPMQAVLALSHVTRGPGANYLIINAPYLRYQHHRLWRELRNSSSLRATIEQLLVQLGLIEYLKYEMTDPHQHWLRFTLQHELDEYSKAGEFAELRRVLHEPPWQAWYAAVQSLGNLNGMYSPDELALLESSLSDRSPYVRAAAARQLGRTQGEIAERVRQALFHTALYDRDLGTRYAAARAIGMLRDRLGDSDARELLTTALFHEDSFVRSAAGLVLAQLGETIVTPSVVESLLVVLADSDTYAREAAATALSSMGDLAATQATLEALTETLLDTDHYVHEAALTALGKLRPIYEANRLHAAPQEAVAS
ncbi:MAG TPA: HEAT repeat domain-containing protein [Herpetosiphonaceae bacterium]